MKLLKTQHFQKKAVFSVKKKQLKTFFNFIGFEKPQETLYKGPKGNLAVTGEVIGSVL